MKKLLALLLLSTAALGQTIAPKDIKPSTTNGDVITTVAGKTKWQAGVSAPVTSVFGRVGNIGANTGDYTCTQITGALCSIDTIFYQTMQAAGADQAQRPKLNLIGGAGIGVVATDNPGSGSTDFVISTSLPTSTDYVWTFNSCNNQVGQPSQCGGTTTLPGDMPSAPYFLHCDVFTGAEPSDQYIQISNWPLPTTSGSTLFYRMVQPMQNGTHGGVSMPVVCNAHVQGTPAFAIRSFSGGQAGELGQTFTNPGFAASYSVSPAMASITNTDGVSSPTVLTSPFTSATIVGSFSHSSIATTTFTLSATQGPTLTATQAITWNPRIFAGYGSPVLLVGWSISASGTDAILHSLGDTTLSSAGLGAETVGQSFGPFTASGDAIYLLLKGGSHTFIDAGTGFPFAFDAPAPVSFVNQYGVTVTMYLYKSSNTLFGTYTPKVAS